MQIMTSYDIDPVPKPRMIIKDRWKKRECAKQYSSFCDLLKRLKIDIKSGDTFIFQFQISKKLSQSKKLDVWTNQSRDYPYHGIIN